MITAVEDPWEKRGIRSWFRNKFCFDQRRHKEYAIVRAHDFVRST